MKTFVYFGVNENLDKKKKFGKHLKFRIKFEILTIFFNFLKILNIWRKFRYLEIIGKLGEKKLRNFEIIWEKLGNLWKKIWKFRKKLKIWKKKLEIWKKFGTSEEFGHFDTN